MKNNVIKCSECNIKYFKENKINKMVRFLGFGKLHSNEVPLKTSPAWCPKKLKARREQSYMLRFKMSSM